MTLPTLDRKSAPDETPAAESPIYLRLEAPTTTWFFHPQNRERFNTPGAPFIIADRHSMMPTTFVIGVVLVGMAIWGTFMHPDLWWLILPLFAFVGLVIPSVLAARENNQINYRFRKTGQLIVGELVSCEGAIAAESGSDQITTVYRFQTPNGSVEGKSVLPRPDLKGKPLPAPGTPVVVLYLSDIEHYLL